MGANNYRELRLAKKMVDEIGNVAFRPAFLSYSFHDLPADFHLKYNTVLLNQLAVWADMYDSGEVTENTDMDMFLMCKNARKMLDSLR